MKRIEAALPQTLRTNVGFPLVSCDSERPNSAGEIVFQQVGLHQDIQPTLKPIAGADLDLVRP